MNESGRIYYIDILKALSIFSVILIHVFALGLTSQVKGIVVSNFSETFKFAVPVFLMVTGTLLLNRDYGSITSFLKKRYSRIIPPYLLWVIFIIFALLLPALLNDGPIVINEIISKIFTFNFAWYFWLMIGTYLMIPVINAFIRTDDIKASKYIVLLFVISSILYQFLMLIKSYSYVELRFFIMPIGYLCLGYLLANYKFKRERLIFIIAILSFITVSAFETIYGQYPELLLILNNLDTGQASNMDVSVLRIIQASSVFLIIKYLSPRLSKIRGIVTNISRSSYGMYLVHIFVYLIYFNFTPVKGSGTNVVFTLLCGTFVIFIASWIIVLMTSKIPFLKKFSGYA